MKQIVIMPGGFHPFHAGHLSLYNAAKEAFPDANVYVAATDSREERPFPFAVKEKLAKVAGVDPGKFIQVKSPFKANEITDHYDPDEDVLIFVRSEKDRNESPKPGGTKKDGSPAYFQPYTGKNMQPFSKHAYMAYLPTVTFGPGIKSATEIRNAWPNLNDRQKTAMVMSLYPATQKNQKLAANVVAMLDQVMGRGQLAEVGDQPYKTPSRWRGGGDGGYTKSIKLPDGRNLEIVVEYQKPYALINFYVDSSQWVTGGGDAVRILSTVANEINDFMGKYKPDILAFTASMANQSRIKLYDRFADRVVKSMPAFQNYTNISDDEDLYGDLLDFADERHDIQEQILYVFASPKYMKNIQNLRELENLAESINESQDYLEEK